GLCGRWRSQIAARVSPDRSLPPPPLSPHIPPMPKKPKSPSRPTRAKASKPELRPLDEHLAALLNPALIDKPPGFAEAPAAFARAAAEDEDLHPRGMSGATATVESLKSLLELGDPNIRDRPTWVPHRPPRPEKSEGGVRFKIVSDYKPKGDQPSAIDELV